MRVWGSEVWPSCRAHVRGKKRRKGVLFPNLKALLDGRAGGVARAAMWMEHSTVSVAGDPPLPVFVLLLRSNNIIII